MKKILLTLLFLVVLPAAIAGECCDEVNGITFETMTVNYVGTATIEQGDMVEVYDAKELGPTDLIGTYSAYPTGQIIHTFTTKAPTKTWFVLKSSTGTVKAVGNFHTSCSRNPGPYDTTRLEDGEDNILDWELTEATFAQANSDYCINLECGPDNDGDGVGDYCDNCLDYYNPREVSDICRCVDNKIDGLQYGINYITFEYTGSSTATTANIYDSGSPDPTKLIATVPITGNQFTILGASGQIGHADTTLEVGSDTGKFHTSCSQPIGPGMVDGNFVILDWDPVTAIECELGPQPPCEEPQELDFGDALDPTYPTLLANNGARHIITPGFFLGISIDPEQDGQPDPNALGDDNDGNDDEDGVVFNTPLIPCQQASITVTASASGLLDAWIDFNDDGDWNDPGEQIFANQPLTTGPNVLQFLVPCQAVPTSTFARFRFSSQGGLLPTGLANDGEVEDYKVAIGEEVPVCGNNILEPGEECDPPTFPDPSEQCDEGEACLENCICECTNNNPPTLNFQSPEAGFTLTESTTISWTWSDTDGPYEVPEVYLFYSIDNGVTWNIIGPGAIDATDNQYIWDSSFLVNTQNPPESVIILGIIYDGCDVGLGDTSGAAEEAGKHDPTDPYDIVSAGGVVPEFTTIGIILILMVVSVFLVVQNRRFKQKLAARKK